MKDSSHRLRSLLTTTALTVLAILPSAVVRANPLDGVVTGGSATIVTGNKTVDVTQQTDRAVIDWRSFNIGVDESTRFYQPNSNSVIVNRINDANPSNILGSLQANGNVVLINPNGVFFGKNSVVDVNGMLATTADIDTHEFMSGSNSFNKASSNTNASIINQGQITAKDAGLVGLVAPNVVNNGVINAKLGRVEMASGDTVTVDFKGNGLTEIAVSDDVKNQLIQNTGTVNAQGGIIAMTAAVGKNIVNNLVAIKGEIKAPGIGVHDGKISIFGNTAQVDVQANLDASGKNANEHGGQINIFGKDITIKSGSTIDAGGNTGGGIVLIGGDVHGTGSNPKAKTVTLEKDAKILNNAITNGDGGKTILWSEDTTNFAGDIEAKGGAQSGKGGFVETSGKQKLIAKGNVDLRASDGSAGNWLLDPANITIYNRSSGNATDNSSTFLTSYLEAQSVTADITLSSSSTLTLDMTGDTLNLANNRNITLNSTGGDITTNSNSGIMTSGSGSILLSSDGYININNDLSLSAGGTGGVKWQADASINVLGGSTNITTQGGNIVLNSTHSSPGNGNIQIASAATLTSHGGDIVLGGGLDPTTGYANNTSYNNGILLYPGSIVLDARGTSSGGNIILNGMSTHPGGGGKGIAIYGSTLETNYNGNITLNGVNNSNGGTNGGAGIITDYGTVISAEAGTITLNGTGGQGNGNYNVGIGLSWNYNGGVDIIRTTTGNIVLNGVGGNGTNGFGIMFDGPAVNSGIFSNSGNITLTGTSTGGSAGIGNFELDDYGFPLTQGSVGNGSTTGTITFITDAFYQYITTQTTGSVVYKPYTAGRTINVANGSTGGLDLSNDLLDHVTAGNITFGSNAQSADINVNAYNWHTGRTFIGNTSSVNFNSAVDGTYDITASGYNINFNGAWGSSVALGNVDLITNNTVYDFYLTSITTAAGKNISAKTLGNNDAVMINGDLTAGVNGNITLTGVNGWVIGVSSSNINVSGTGSVLLSAGSFGMYNVAPLNITAAGSGSVTLQSDNSITFASVMNITTHGGNITVNSSRNIANNGNISFNDGSSGSFISNGGNIVLGGGLDPTTGYAYRNGNHNGVELQNATLDARGSASGGNIIINGQANRSGGSSDGIFTQNSVTIETNFNGNITLTGNNITTGGSSDNQGIYLSGPGTTAGTQILAQAGTITLTGTGSASTGGNSQGILISDNNSTDIIQTTSGNIIINGTGGGGTNSGGVVFTSPNASGGVFSDSGNITITGIATSGGNYGIDNGSAHAGQTVQYGHVGNGSTTGNITYIADSISAPIVTTTTGSVVFKPYTNSTAINVADGSTGGLDLSTAILNAISAGNLTIGSNVQSAAINVNAYSWNSNVTLLSDSGVININGAQALGSKAFTATVSGNNNINLSANIISTAGNITLTSGNTIRAPGAGFIQTGGTGNITLISTGNTAGVAIGESTYSLETLGSGNITLTAAGNIVLNGGNQITTHGGNIILNADSGGAGGFIHIANAAGLYSHGGNITMGGGNNPLTTTNKAVSSTNDGVQNQGISIHNSTVDASGSSGTGGNISLRGEGSDNTIDAAGITLLGSTLSTNNNGTISLVGKGGSVGHGVILSGSLVQTASGALTITGTGGAGTGAGYNAGIVPLSGLATLQSGSGAITLNASAGVNSTDVNYEFILPGSMLISSTSGNVTVNGNTILGNNLTINSGSGDTVFNNHIIGESDLAITAHNITLSGDNGGGGAGLFNVNLTATNNITLSAITMWGGKNLTLIADYLTLNGDITGTGDLTIQPYSNGRTISVGNQFFTPFAGDTWSMFLTKGEVDHFVDGWNQINIGRSDYVGYQSIGQGISFKDNVKFWGGSWGSVVIDDVTTTGSASIEMYNGFNMQGSITALGSGNITLDSIVYFENNVADLVTHGGNITASYVALDHRGGNIISNGGNILIGSMSSTSDPNTLLTIDAGAGNLTVSNTINGLFDLVASAGTMNLLGAIGDTTSLISATLTSVSSIVLPEIHAGTVNATVTGASNNLTTGKITTGTGGNITLIADNMTIGDDLSGTGIFTIKPNDHDREIQLNYGTNDGYRLNLDTTEIGHFKNGWNNIVIGRKDNTYTFGGINIGNTAWTDSVLFQTGSVVDILGNVTVTDGASLVFDDYFARLPGTITTDGGNVTFKNILFAYVNGSLTTNGGETDFDSIWFNQDVHGPATLTVNTGGGDINVGNIRDQGHDANLSTLILNAGSGDVTTGFARSAADLTISGHDITVTDKIGNLIGDYATPILAGNISLTASNSVSLQDVTLASGKNLSITTDYIALNGDVSGTGTLTIQSYSTNRSIGINSNYNTGDVYLTTADVDHLVDGWSQIYIGRTDDSGYMTLGDAIWKDNVTFRNGGYTAVIGTNSVTGNSSVVFDTLVDVGAILETQGTGNITFNNATGINNGIGHVITHGGDISFNSVVYVKTGGGVIESNGGDITIIGTITNPDASANQVLNINAGAGDLSFGNTIDGAFDFSAAANSVAFNGAIGSNVAINNVTLNSVDSLSLPAITTVAGKAVAVMVSGAGSSIITSTIATGTNGNVTLIADDMTIGDDLSGTGTLSIQQYDPNRDMNINRGPDAAYLLSLDLMDMSHFVNGWNLIELGNNTATGQQYIGAVTFHDSVVFYSQRGRGIYGGLTMDGGSSLTFENGWTEIQQDITTDGGSVNYNNANAWAFGGNITTNGGAVNIIGGTLGNPDTNPHAITINTGGGDITIGQTYATSPGTIDVTLTAGAGDITLGNVLGDTTMTASGHDINITSTWSTNADASLTATNNITSTGFAVGAHDLTLTAGDVALNGNVSGTGTLTVQTYDGRAIDLNGPNSNYPGVLSLDTAEINHIVNGWSLINIGRASQASATLIGDSTWHDPVAFNGQYKLFTGNVIGDGNASFTFNNGRTDLDGTITTAGQNVTFNEPVFGYNGTITSNGGDVYLSNALIWAPNFALTVNSGGGDITIANSTYEAQAPTNYDKSLIFNAGSGDVIFGGAVNGGYNVSVTAQNIIFGGDWGATPIGLGTVTLTSVNDLILPNAIHANSITATVTGSGNRLTTNTITATGAGGNVTLTADDMTINGDVSGTGNLVVRPNDPTRNFNVTYSPVDQAGFLTLDYAEVTHLEHGWNSIEFGRNDLASTIYMGNHSWNSSVIYTVGNTGQILISGTQDVTGNNNITFNGSSLLQLDVTSDTGNITFNGVTKSIMGARTISNSGNISYTDINMEDLNWTPATNVVAQTNGNISVSGNITQGTTDSTGKLISLNANNGNVTLNGTVDGTFDLTANGNTIVANSAIGNTTALGAVHLTSVNSIALPVIKANSILVEATGGSSSIALNGALTTTGSGSALVLAGHSFTNNIGANALNATNGGRFLVWTADPSLDSRNSQAYAFKQYNATYGVTAVAGTENGFLYSIAPTLAINLQNTVNKTYDGNDGATLAGSNYTVANGIDGDTFSISGTGIYNNKNVGTNKNVAVTGMTVTAADGSATVYGYQYNTSANANIGNISAANLTITANDATKTYGDTVTFNGTEFTHGTLLGTDSISSVSLSSTGTGATANASGSLYHIVASGASGTGLSNYNITYVDGSLTVNKADLTIIANNAHKDYGTVKTFNGTEFTSSGLLNSDSISTVTLTSLGALATANVAGGPYAINANNASGSGLSNYNIVYYGGILTVDKVGLTVTANDLTKTYGTTLNFIGNEFTTTGLLNGDHIDGVTLASSGAAGIATVAGGPYGITASNATGSAASNYNITYVGGHMNVIRADLNISALDYYKQLSETLNLSGTDFVATGLYNTDTITQVSLSSSGAVNSAGYGIYPVMISNAVGSGLNNYNIIYHNGKITVSTFDVGNDSGVHLPQTVQTTSQDPNSITNRSNRNLSSMSVSDGSLSLVDFDMQANANKKELKKPVKVMNSLVEIDPALLKELAYNGPAK